MKGSRSTPDPSALRARMRAAAQAGPPVVPPPPDTSAFRRWFAGSAVVDEAGRPLVVYHHTWAEFRTFDRLAKAHERRGAKIDTVGSWFTTDPKPLYGPRVIAVYLAIRNPLRFVGRGAWRQFARSVEAEGDAEAFRAKVKAEGHDGVAILGDHVDTREQDCWIAFESTQIEFATDNGGTSPPARRGGANESARAWEFGENVGLPTVWFHPLDYLRLTSTPADSPCLEKAKIARYARSMGAGRPFPVPGLSVAAWRDGVSVVSHDGRHRALAAHRSGARAIPIVLHVEDWGDGLPPLDRVLAGEPVRWLTQAYDDEEIEECGFTRDKVVTLRSTPPSRGTPNRNRTRPAVSSPRKPSLATLMAELRPAASPPARAPLHLVQWYDTDEGPEAIYAEGVTVGKVRYAEEGEAEGGFAAFMRFMGGAFAPHAKQPPRSPAGWYWQATTERRGVWNGPHGPFATSAKAVEACNDAFATGAYLRKEE